MRAQMGVARRGALLLESRLRLRESARQAAHEKLRRLHVAGREPVADPPPGVAAARPAAAPCGANELAVAAGASVAGCSPISSKR